MSALPLKADWIGARRFINSILTYQLRLAL